MTTHLATYEEEAAARAHLAVEHPAGCAQLGVRPATVPLPVAVHQLLTDERTYFPEEEPA
jgi:hypothetical protein